MNMEKKLIAQDLLNKFVEWELECPKYKNNYKKSTTTIYIIIKKISLLHTLCN